MTLVFALLLPICPAAAAQQPAPPQKLKVGGTVLDSDRQPLPGAQVVEKGTANATVTGSGGHYTITVSGAEAVLAISHPQMAPVEVPVKGRTAIVTMLNDASVQMDELVVIGYGTVAKSDLTGSVAVFRSEDMEDRVVLSLEDALRGRVAGVSVGSNDGQPGEQLNIRIRGTGSINASSAPLYVVDGVPMEELDISYNEVEHMELLRDASSTAIYGSRGANGVVLITTKKGKAGKPSIDLSFKASWQTPVRLIEMMDSYDYNLYRNIQRRNVYRSLEALVNSSNSNHPNTDLWDRYTDQYGNIWIMQKENRWYADHMSGKYLDPQATNTDWQRLMLRNTMTYDGRVNISGGNDQTTYSVIGTFMSQDGMVYNSSYERYGVRANMEHKVNRRFKMGINLSGSRSFQQGAYTNEVDGTMMNMIRQQPVKEPNYTETFEDVEGESSHMNNNPWFQAKYVKREVTKDNILVKAWFDHKIGRDFRFNTSGSYAMNNNFNDQFYPAMVKVGLTANGIALQNRKTTYDWLNENIMYYEPKAKGRHKYDAMAGLTFQETDMRLLNSEIQKFTYDKLQEWGMNYGLTPITPKIDRPITRMMSVLARANYTYNKKYMFTASMRADGSSRFGANHKWGYFPSGAFAWRLSQEEFIRRIKPISDLKLRLSAGVSGNTAIPPYQTLAMAKASNYPMNGDIPSSGAVIERVENGSLKWETTTQYNAGVDVGLFKNRVSATVEVYLKQTRDLLLLEPVTGTSGYTSRWSNRGKIDNKGLEITLTGRVIQNSDWKWTTGYNMAFNRSKVRYIGESGELILNSAGTGTENYAILREGMPVGLWYGYVTDGLYRTFAEIDRLPDSFVQFAKTKKDMGPGFMRYIDQNNDGIIDAADRVVIGCAEPKFIGGWNNTVTWKDLRLNVNAEFSYGRKVFNATALYLERGVQADNSTIRYRDNYWHPALYNEANELVFPGNEENSWLPGTPSNGSYGEVYAKDLYIEDGSYLRISDVSLTYSLPKKLAGKLSANAIRVTASVRNAWLWTKYTGYDPDVNSVSGDYADLIPGLDNGSYPRARTYMIGLNITF